MKSISAGYHSDERTKRYIPPRKLFECKEHCINTDDTDNPMFSVCDTMFVGFDLSVEKSTEEAELDECIEFLQNWDFKSMTGLETSEEDKPANNGICFPKELFEDIHIEKSTEVQNTVSSNSSIESLFQKRGYVISNKTSLEENACLKDVTIYIGDHFRKLTAFFKQIRQQNNYKAKTIYNYGDSLNTKNCVDILAGKLRKCGIVSYYKCEDEKITITWNNTHNIRQYIKGEWLEHYASLIAEKKIAEFAERNNLDYEILMNVKLTDEKKPKSTAHELDVVFRIGDQIFAIEAKSGNFSQYDKLFDTYRELKLIPWHYIVVGINADEESIERMFGFYASGINRTKIAEKINKMIVKSFETV